MNLFDRIPDELLLLIIGYFKRKDITAIRNISSSFLNLNDSALKSLIYREFGLSNKMLNQYNMEQLVRIFKLMSCNRISAGENYLLGLTVDEQVYSCGYNGYGQLGSGDFLSRDIPYLIPELKNIVDISAGDNYSLILTSNGQVYSFGNYCGILGVVGPGNGSIPLLIPSLKNIVAISAGMGHSLALNDDGQVFSFGSNCNGQLGLDDYAMRQIPTLISGLPKNIIAISAGGYHSLALTSDGYVYGFGANNYNQLGRRNDHDWRYYSELSPSLVSVKNIVAISAGGKHSLALNKDGQVYSFGHNDAGQLGRGVMDYDQENDPELIPLLDNIIAISAGDRHSLTLTSDGKVYSFGNNNYEFRDCMPRSRPELIPELINVVSISGGTNHSLILFADGHVVSFNKYCHNIKLEL